MALAALGYAARTGKMDAAQALIAAGAPVRVTYVRHLPAPVQGTSPLQEAVGSGDPAMAELMITSMQFRHSVRPRSPWRSHQAMWSSFTSWSLMARIPALKNLDGLSAADEAAKVPESARTTMLQIMAAARGVLPRRSTRSCC